MNKILILTNFAFSKEEAVGGRRWRKFIPLIQNEFDQIFVLCEGGTSQSFKDNHKIQIVTFVNYLQSLKKIRFPFLKSLGYRFSMLLSRMLISGNYYDNSEFVGQSMARWIHRLLEQHPDDSVTLIMSMGPFRYTLPIIKKVELFKNVKTILDYRDPWSSNELAFGIKHLTNQRKSEEKKLEKRVVESCAGIIGVHEHVWMSPQTVRFPSCQIIKNGLEWQSSRPIDYHYPIKILFLGTMYEDTEDLLIPLLEQLHSIQHHDPSFYENFEWNFVGHIQPFFKAKISELNLGNIKMSPSVSNEDSQILRSECHIGLNITHRDFTYSMNTKFLEILGGQKQTLYVGWPGETSTFIARNKIGYHWNPNENLIDILQAISKDFSNKNLNIPFSPEIQSLTIESQSKKLIQFIHANGFN